MKVLHARFKGKTASFRIPFAVSGVQASSPVPTYGNLLGLLSCCAGRLVTPEDTRIGFAFSYDEKAQDLERIIRWDYGTPGKPKLNVKGQGIRKRDFLVNPVLDLFVTNLAFKEHFLKPKGIPALGRSQDICYIDLVEEVDVEPTRSGKVAGSLIAYKRTGDATVPGLLLRLPERMVYDDFTRMRRPVNVEMFVATNATRNARTPVELESGLFTVNSPAREETCIHVHDWLS